MPSIAVLIGRVTIGSFHPPMRWSAAVIVHVFGKARSGGAHSKALHRIQSQIAFRSYGNHL